MQWSVETAVACYSKLAPLYCQNAVATMRRRREDKIRRLCNELLAATADEEQQILADLRNLLHQFIENLRARVAAYPRLVERRVRNEIPESRQ